MPKAASIVALLPAFLASCRTLPPVPESGALVDPIGIEASDLTLESGLPPQPERDSQLAAFLGALSSFTPRDTLPVCLRLPSNVGSLGLLEVLGDTRFHLADNCAIPGLTQLRQGQTPTYQGRPARLIDVLSYGRWRGERAWAGRLWVSDSGYYRWVCTVRRYRERWAASRCAPLLDSLG